MMPSAECYTDTQWRHRWCLPALRLFLRPMVPETQWSHEEHEGAGWRKRNNLCCSTYWECLQGLHGQICEKRDTRNIWSCTTVAEVVGDGYLGLYLFRERKESTWCRVLEGAHGMRVQKPDPPSLQGSVKPGISKLRWRCLSPGQQEGLTLSHHAFIFAILHLPPCIPSATDTSTCLHVEEVIWKMLCVCEGCHLQRHPLPGSGPLHSAESSISESLLWLRDY